MMDLNMTAEEAKRKLIEGNKKYVTNDLVDIHVNKPLLKKFRDIGQKPYAIVVTCSDSRVIPDAIFDAKIGDLFVIRVAGNVIDDHQLGSIEYAADHLGTPLVLVLGHTHCGAVDAVLAGHASGYIKYIAEDISEGIGDEKDPYQACILNVKHSCDHIESSLLIQEDEKEGLEVVGAVYDIVTGEVEFVC